MNDDSVMYISYAEIEHGGSGTDKNWADWSADLNPLPPLSTKGLRSVYDAWGSGSDDWWVRNVRFNVRVIDTKEPAQISLAPMAEGQYRRGDTITLSVVYDEIVANRNNASLGSISGLSPANVTYRGERAPMCSPLPQRSIRTATRLTAVPSWRKSPSGRPFTIWLPRNRACRRLYKGTQVCFSVPA